jgi:aminopeptidase-like protein
MWRNFYHQFAAKFSGDLALAHAREQNRIERYFTFPNFVRSAERCADEMRKSGLSDVELEAFPADGTASWSGWPTPQAWDVESAQLWLTSPHRELLADWSVKPQHLVMYSGPARLTAELLEWNGELGSDLRGKIPLTHRRINDVFESMRALGVGGIVSDFIGTLPGVRDAFDLPDDVRWENSAIRPGKGAFWGFMISPRHGRMLRDLLRQGRVQLDVQINSRVYDGEFHSATGVIQGAEIPEEEILFLSHLYEPGANDNASGTGVGLALAHTLNEAIVSGFVRRPRRSIRFLFGWEGLGLQAWVEKHQARLARLLGGLNIDEIGVDQHEGRSVLHLFKPPAANPSCVGYLAEHLCENIFTPHLRWKAVADRTEIINDMVTSDPNINVVLPCFIQYPSRHYHSSSDTVETLSAPIMKKVGAVTATHLYLLANAGLNEAHYLARLVVAAAQRELGKVELRLLERSWPFDRERSSRWFAEQFALSVQSLAAFSLPMTEVQACQQEVSELVQHWSERLAMNFPAGRPRTADAKDHDRAGSLVLCRVTLGAPSLYGFAGLSPDEGWEFRRVLLENNCDMLLHRICYWADGKRSLLQIIDRLEIELDQLLPDAHLARTASGSMFDDTRRDLDLRAVLYIVGHLIRGGYLKEV